MIERISLYVSEKRYLLWGGEGREKAIMNLNHSYEEEFS